MTRWATLALTAAGAVLPALAHHSTSMYDRSTPITMEAEVVAFRWVNPHSYLTVVETGAASGAAPKTWSIEMSSPGVLTRNGWTKRTFNPGDEDAGGIFMEAILADGKVMIYSTELPTE